MSPCKRVCWRRAAGGVAALIIALVVFARNSAFGDEPVSTPEFEFVPAKVLESFSDGGN
jgi:hypothetical protein